MQRYVVGFAFDAAAERVALIRKNKPQWQAGKWNGIGGHVGPGETPGSAMVREFHEETGALVMGWQRFVQLQDARRAWCVDFYRARSVNLDKLRSTTDEVVQCWYTRYATHPRMDILPNLRWLIPLAADDDVHGGFHGVPMLVDRSGVPG